MNIFKKIPDDIKIKEPVITIGTFDGVHLGHREIFKQVLRAAKSEKSSHLVLTFEPHPRKIINPGTPPRILTTTDEKVKAISDCGIENIIVMQFTNEMAAMQPVDFLEKIIFSEIGMSHLVVGYDHAFGKNRDGDWNFLKNISLTKGFAITRVDHLDFHSSPVSSTWIRAEIEDGNISLANSLLGRPYSLTGTVVKGEGIGRKLGFPTANINPADQDKVIPKDGVYAVSLCLHDSRIKAGMINIGKNPTFANAERTIEVNIFDFNEDIYGKSVEVFFQERIRDEIKFGNIDELITQLDKDKITVKNIIKDLMILN